MVNANLNHVSYLELLMTSKLAFSICPYNIAGGPRPLSQLRPGLAHVELGLYELFIQSCQHKYTTASNVLLFA